jgi:hypothetical protein
VRATRKAMRLSDIRKRSDRDDAHDDVINGQNSWSRAKRSRGRLAKLTEYLVAAGSVGFSSERAPNYRRAIVSPVAVHIDKSRILRRVTKVGGT